MAEMRTWNRTWTHFRAFLCHRSSLCIRRENLRWPFLGASGDLIDIWLNRGGLVGNFQSLAEVKLNMYYRVLYRTHQHQTSYDCTWTSSLRLSTSSPIPSGLEFE